LKLFAFNECVDELPHGQAFLAGALDHGGHEGLVPEADGPSQRVFNEGLAEAL
jgi:hypothetical protein